MIVKIENSYANFFWTEYTFKNLYVYLLCLHYNIFHRLKYYLHAFTEYYNRNVRKVPIRVQFGTITIGDGKIHFY